VLTRDPLGLVTLHRDARFNVLSTLDIRPQERIDRPGEQRASQLTRTKAVPMASHVYSTSHVQVSAAVDPVAYWTTQDFSDSSPLTMHLSPGGSSTTQESVHSNTPPAQLQTPRSDSAQAQAAKDAQNAANAAANRTSVAVACVPCRSRHLKCDGGVRCSRCRADGVDCTYIKSRRGWKGKRKSKPGENGAPTLTIPGGFQVSCFCTRII
jgi:hypothetical protein